MVTIGASQIAAVLGQNPYQTPQELYEQLRTGAQTPDNEHMLRGRIFEGSILTWWEHLAQQQLRRSPQTKPGADERQVSMVHPCGWARATPDGLTVDGGTVVEAKCPAGWRAWDDRSGKYPYHYHLQVVWQMGVAQACGLEVQGAELIAGPVYGRLLRFRIAPDPELFALAMTRAETFLQCVEGGTPLPEAFNQREAAP
jgi:putative phage-type endonuclease